MKDLKIDTWGLGAIALGLVLATQQQASAYIDLEDAESKKPLLCGRNHRTFRNFQEFSRFFNDLATPFGKSTRTVGPTGTTPAGHLGSASRLAVRAACLCAARTWESCQAPSRVARSDKLGRERFGRVEPTPNLPGERRHAERCVVRSYGRLHRRRVKPWLRPPFFGFAISLSLAPAVRRRSRTARFLGLSEGEQLAGGSGPQPPPATSRDVVRDVRQGLLEGQVRLGVVFDPLGVVQEVPVPLL